MTRTNRTTGIGLSLPTHIESRWIVGNNAHWSQAIWPSPLTVLVEPGLYVLDGALIPKPIGRNPSRTIAALAERAVEKM